MINSREDYLYYLECDKVALDKKDKRPKFDDYIWKYERAMRKLEYYTNCKRKIFYKPYIKYLRYKFKMLGVKLGYDIPINSIGPGLALPHRGPIVINSSCKIGKNFRTHVCVNIGTAAGTVGKAPIIGDNVYIGPGAKLFGDIIIGNNVAIGANSVVNKSFPDNVTIAGAPAKIINYKGSEGFLIKATEKVNSRFNKRINRNKNMH